MTEGFKDHIQFIRRDADARVANREMQGNARIIAGLLLHLQRYRSCLGELERIPDQVDNHLPQPARIAQ